jgi:hypothetical protein
LERTVIKDQNRSKKGQQQASTLQTSNDVQSSTPSLPLSHADRVLTQFTDGKWYTGNIHGDYPKGHLILFDGYESHGVSKISFHLVKPYITVKLPHEHPPSTPDRTTATNLEELKRANTATQQRSNAAKHQHNNAVMQHSITSTQQINATTQSLSNAATQQSNSATQQLSNSATQQRSNAETQKRRNTATQQRSNAATQQPTTQQRSNATTQQRSNAETQQRINASTQQRNTAQMRNTATQHYNAATHPHNTATQQRSNAATQQRRNTATQHSLCRKLFEKGGGLLSVFRSAITSTDYQLGSIVVQGAGCLRQGAAAVRKTQLVVSTSLHSGSKVVAE